jgi:hypothetical protein
MTLLMQHGCHSVQGLFIVLATLLLLVAVAVHMPQTLLVVAEARVGY